jgi:hypothetical protein
MLRRPTHLRRRRPTTDTTRADDAPIRQPPCRWVNAPVEEVRLLRTCTGGQVYQLHRRHWVEIFISSSDQEHLPRGAVALLDRDCGCTDDSAACTAAGDPQTPLPPLKRKAFPHSR